MTRLLAIFIFTFFLRGNELAVASEICSPEVLATQVKEQLHSNMSPPEGARILKPEEYLQIEKAVLWTEKLVKSRYLSSRGSAPEPVTPAEAPLGPLGSEALGECGNTQKDIASILTSLGVPVSQLHFLQMSESAARVQIDTEFSDRTRKTNVEKTDAAGFVGKASSHAVTVYETLDKSGNKQYLFLDVTLMQVPEDVQLLSQTQAGREILEGVYREGFWIANDARLKVYAQAMEVEGNQARVPTMSDLGRSYPDSETSLKEKIATKRNYGQAFINQVQATDPAQIYSRQVNGDHTLRSVLMQNPPHNSPK